jgi:hypothetical protein
MHPGSTVPRNPGGFCWPDQNSFFAWQLMSAGRLSLTAI